MHSGFIMDVVIYVVLQDGFSKMLQSRILFFPKREPHNGTEKWEEAWEEIVGPDDINNVARMMEELIAYAYHEPFFVSERTVPRTWRRNLERGGR